jgi:hypothetical protein
MSAAAQAPSQRGSGRNWKLILGFLIVIGAGVALAWAGAGSLRSEVTESGLRFRVVEEGKGEPIADADAALLDYVLTADDGTVIDSSQSHGGPQPFTAGAVFPGFAEAMRRMREGGEYRFTMPQKLAFGDRPAPPEFPAGTALTFNVKVGKIVRGGAALMQQGMQRGEPPQPEPGPPQP